jgi:hypothetical protein
MQYTEIVTNAKEQWHAANPHTLRFGLRMYNSNDLSSLCAAIPKPKHGDEWGNWRLDTEGEPSLDFADGEFYSKGDPYWIRVSELKTDAGLLKWLKHLSEKVWFSQNSNNAGNFVNAVFALRKVRAV